MKRLDLIINALDRVDTFDWNQQDNKLIKDALAAAHSLRAMEPVAWAAIDKETNNWFVTTCFDAQECEIPLYALGDEK